VRSRQYLVEFPDRESAKKHWGERVHQDSRELALSTATRKVAHLAVREVEELRHVRGVRVFLNRVVTIPPHESRRLIPADQIQQQLTVAVPTHGADKLHAMGIKGQGVTVAVLDSGIAPHSDLGGSADIKKFYDVWKRQETPAIDDNGHGTHCAGIVSAAGNVTGIAPDSALIGIKVLDKTGTGSVATVVAGIDKAIEYFKAGYRPMVLSLSFGLPAKPVANDPLVAKVKEAADLGIFVAVAAGNNGPKPGTMTSPGTAHHPRILTVAAFDTQDTTDQADDEIAPFSSVGDSTRPDLGQDTMDVGADGVDVVSLAPANGYAKASGTSAAAPIVAAGLALLMSKAYQLAAEGRLRVKPEDINYAQLLATTANDHGDIDQAHEGRGELRIDKALEKMLLDYAKSGGARP
jgi:subtilisin family serine protease